MQQDQVFILQKAHSEVSKDSERSFKLVCWAYDWDGDFFNRVPYSLYITSFKDKRSINTLEHYPMEFHWASKDLYRNLVLRGKRFHSLCIWRGGAQMFDYKGLSIEDQNSVTLQQRGSRVSKLTEAVSLHRCGKSLLMN